MSGICIIIMMKISCMLKQVDSMIVFPSLVYPLVFPRVPRECFFSFPLVLFTYQNASLDQSDIHETFFSDLIGI